MLKVRVTFVILLAVLACGLPPSRGVGAAAQRRRAARRPPAVCPDPTARCRTSVEFQPYQLPFELGPNAVIFETEKFYAVILKSMRDTSQDCTVFVPEAERLEAQGLFPRHKVFATRCYEPGELFYEGIAPEVMFMAVYAGRTRAEAARMLERVKATGRFPGAYLRRTSTGFNGT
ncbi:MAG TPA: hypothetical protein VF611_09385 [Pyrinomonadaceae bacterium]|jgi:hypothetical protein